MAVAACLSLAVSAGCSSESGSNGATSAATSSAAASAPSVAITSWATWAQNYQSEIEDCAGETDSCFTQNHATMAEMRQSIIDNNLPIDGTNSGIVNPMQLYQETYAKFTEQNCIGGPQDMNSANVVCNVKRDQMRVFGSQVKEQLDSMATG
ncbi:hypothetical protein SEA_FLORAL_17 [Gordonia phage Floral]|uniref:Uncharacterized protein n=1 Tax=Gordonia phage BritBrat TaxID=1838064 RepID=A0A166XZ21_9CAUD|nr:hypothetical protein BH769_gp17 [Gordonia phage BritBrat]AXH48347.1 hypothetical protein SEA_POLLUX_17 [Gordonia phage Pollux]QAY17620.1 hypothetical protein SEA_EMSQUAREDA_17 [Gordonia phage EMsquaredA]QDP45102.1 hypothetical protein SEA_MARTEENA_17 [Gordonia phage Marteena]QZD97150.1 hypothetical protein SEA_FLORAL_17 [Gordonia phage Floral]ANA85225.1 hypothetical protein PBI_BRITBRAT_17 [Gordonia phage BritBrat]